MIFGLTQGLNRRGQGVAHDMNPEPFEESGIVCKITVNHETVILETTPQVPAARSEDFDTVAQNTSQAPASRSEDFDTVAQTIDDNCTGDTQ